MAELVDAHDSKSCTARCAGSIPALGTALSEAALVTQHVARAFLFLRTNAGKLFNLEFGVSDLKVWCVLLNEFD